MSKKRKNTSYFVLIQLMIVGLILPFSGFAQTTQETRRASHQAPPAHKLVGQNEQADKLIQGIAKSNILSRIGITSYNGLESQSALVTTKLQEFPRSGSQYIIMSNGSIDNIPDSVTDFTSVDLGGEVIIGGSPDGFDAYDVATLSVSINLTDIPVSENPRLVFRYKFCSEEPPSFWGSDFQDYFTAYVKNSDDEVIRNIALLPNGDTFTIDNARPYMNQVTGYSESPEPEFPTPNDVIYNACTGIHTTDFNLSDLEGQVITLEFEIGDVADGIYDSGVFIDGLEVQTGDLPDFYIDRVEFNQASQSFEGGQTLAASRLVSGTRFGTGVRAYVVGNNNASDPKSISGRLHLYKDGSPVEGSPFRPVPLRIEPVENPSRTAVDSDEKPTETLQFYLPRSATIEPGDYEFYIDADPDNEVDEQDTNNNRYPLEGFSTVTYNERSTLNVLLLRITPVNGDGNVVNPFTAADDEKYLEQRRYAYRIFPRHVDFWFNDMDWDLDKTSGFFWWEKNIGDLSTKDGRDELFSTIKERMNNSSRDYHSVIAMLPCSTDLYENANGWGFIGSPGGIVRTCSNSTLTHEIAHNWLPADSFDAPDKDHDPSNSGDDGLWVGPEMKLKLNKANILNVGSNDPWVSPESYTALYENNSLTNSKINSNMPKQVVASNAQSNGVRITGWFDDQGELIVRPLTTVNASAFTSNDPDGNYIIEFLDATENVVDSFRFSPPLVYEHDIAPSPGPFGLTVPTPESFESIVFRPADASKTTSASMITNQVRTITVSENAPTVTLNSPSGGEVADGNLTIDWIGNDPDEDAISYTIEYSNDGTNFEMISTLLSGESYELDTSLLPGSTTASIRIIATDGYNTTVVNSAEFEVTTKSPDPTIMSPDANSGAPIGAPVSFEGEAYDLEDRNIPEEMLTWSSDIDGALGTGVGFSTTQLSAGTHTITLSATDSNDNTAIESITFSVVNTTPNAPANVIAEARDGSIDVQWGQSSGEHVDGYKVYWGTISGSYIEDFDVENNTSHTITDLDNGKNYFVAVTAYDVIGNESSFSNEAEAIPSLLPALVQPENNATGVESIPSFTWNTVDGVNSYRMQLALTSNFEEGDIVVDSTNVETTELIILSELDENKEYFWRVGGVYDSGLGAWSNVWSFTTGLGTSIESPDLPTVYSLSQNYPNPFNPTTIISYGLPEASDVQIVVFNMLGQRVATLVNERKTAGWHESKFDASNLSSGIYFYRLTAGNFVETKKLTLIK